MERFFPFFRSVLRVNCYKNKNNWPNECIKSVDDIFKKILNDTYKTYVVNISKETIQLTNEIGNIKNLNFTGRTAELEKIEESFLSHKYIYIIAGSGYGETTLAMQYASSIKEKPNQLVVEWIDSISLVNSTRNLAEELNINLKEKVKSEELFDLVKNNLNNYTKLTNKNVMFIIDNLVYKDDEFNSNIEFLK
jgi:replicative DNA helicase